MDNYSPKVSDIVATGRVRYLAQAAMVKSSGMAPSVFSYDAFVSYNGTDRDAVEFIASQLRQSGINTWIDLWDSRPGQKSQANIELAFESSAACLIFIGPSGVGEGYQGFEIGLATRRQGEDPAFRIIPVLLPGAERGKRSHLPAVVAQNTWVEFRKGLEDQTALARLVGEIRGIATHELPKSIQNEPPYKGLQPFDIGDSQFFYGREALTQWVVNEISTSVGKRINRFLAIIGSSGSGKSSLARAGLIASIKRGELDGSAIWPIVVVRPGSEPLENLAIGLAAAMSSHLLPSEVIEWIGEFRKDRRALHLASKLALKSRPDNCRILFLIDQFEEVFTLCTDKYSQRAFIDNILHAAYAPEGGAVVVLTMRADFYGFCSYHKELAEAVSDHQLLIGPLTSTELVHAIVKPAESLGKRFEAGLVALLLRDVEGEPGSLPFLQHALLQLWHKANNDTITTTEYSAIGGVHGALTRCAEGSFAALDERGQEICRWIFVRLTQPGSGHEDTRRRVYRKEFVSNSFDPEAVDQVLAHLSDTNSRLLTTSRDSSGHRTIEVSHETLIRSWPRLRGWIDEGREAFRILRQLSDAAHRWEQNSRQAEYVLRGPVFAEALRSSRIYPRDLNVLEQEFLEASIVAEIHALLSSSTDSLHEAIGAMRSYASITRDALVAAIESGNIPSAQKWRLRLVLLEIDPSQIDDLIEALLSCEPAEFSVIMRFLSGKEALVIETLLMHSARENHPSRLLRAASAMAMLDPDSNVWPSWKVSVANALAEEHQLSVHYWLTPLRSVREQLVPALRDVLSERLNRNLDVDTVVACLIDLCNDDIAKLALIAGDLPESKLRNIHTPLAAQHERSPATVMEALQTAVSQVNGADINPLQRVRMSRRCSNVLGLLAQLGYLKESVDLLQKRASIEDYTQWAFSSIVSELPILPLIEHFTTLKTPQAKYYLLLALGARNLSTLDIEARKRLGKMLSETYERDANAGLHSAAGWVLDRCGLGEERLHLDRAFANHAIKDCSWEVREINGILVTFAHFSPATYTMGSPECEPGRESNEVQHLVSLTRPLAVGTRLLTWLEYSKMTLRDLNQEEQAPTATWHQTPAHPVVSRTWPEAVSYCSWLSQLAGMSNDECCIAIEGEISGSKDEGQGYRLLTEAEWEYCCRSGSYTGYSFGDDASKLIHFGWFLDNSPERRTRPPGILAPNMSGLFDMHGNVWEWCLDWYGAYTTDNSATVDPVGPARGDLRVLRGGGNNYSAKDCRSAYRYYTQPNNRHPRIGFRLAFNLF